MHSCPAKIISCHVCVCATCTFCRAMRRPRCGLPDKKADLDDGTRRRRYAVTGQRWDKDHISYRYNALTHIPIKCNVSTMKYISMCQYIGPAHPALPGSAEDLWCDPQSFWRVAKGHGAYLPRTTGSAWQQQPGSARGHPVVVCLWFPWRHVLVWWRGGLTGPCLLPRACNGRGYTLWCRWALDFGQSKPPRLAACYYFVFKPVAHANGMHGV